jgi:hypothetical protein
MSAEKISSSPSRHVCVRIRLITPLMLTIPSLSTSKLLVRPVPVEEVCLEDFELDELHLRVLDRQHPEAVQIGLHVLLSHKITSCNSTTDNKCMRESEIL